MSRERLAAGQYSQHGVRRHARCRLCERRVECQWDGSLIGHSDERPGKFLMPCDGAHKGADGRIAGLRRTIEELREQVEDASAEIRACAERAEG